MRYFIYISYDGARFHGWQIQPNGLSVQEVLQDSLSTVLRTRIEVVGAGRTDAGVNASEMVAHFDYMDELSPMDLTRKLNRILPKDVTVDHLAQVKNDAHARFDAISRTYKYYISTKRHPFLRHYAYYYPQTLDYHLMNEAAKRLFYYTDFTSFSKLHTDVKTNNCKIMQAEWRKIDNLPYIASDLSSCDLWEFTIQADRFLRNMVRAIVGTLIDVGRGRLSLLDFCRIIELKDRCAAGVSVPGHALFLHQVSYPDELFILQK